jgi:hypothetical protein
VKEIGNKRVFVFHLGFQKCAGKRKSVFNVAEKSVAEEVVSVQTHIFKDN